jgi:hypothetical protein
MRARGLGLGEELVRRIDGASVVVADLGDDVALARIGDFDVIESQRAWVIKLVRHGWRVLP